MNRFWTRTGFPAGAAALVAGVAIGITGCRSASIAATVTNRTGGPVSQLEIDYPSASFGANSLDTSASYPYRFELIGSGPLKASWMDAAKRVHNSTGPNVAEGEHGTLVVILQPDGTATWQPQLTR